MKKGEKGFTIIEVLVATAIMALIAGAATQTTFQVYDDTRRNGDHVTAVRQVQNAGYWIGRDARMAEIVYTENLTTPAFMVINWTEWDVEDTVYHSVTYSIEDLSGNIGKIKRRHQDSGGTDEETLISQYIYYDGSDPDNTTSASFSSPVLTVRVTARCGDYQETREYLIYRRSDF
jgi:prepilin-type N-terminal cleavage/methylation domain-containing protein